MPRYARIKVKGEPAVYHIMSRTALDGFVMEDVEKDYLLNLIRRLSRLYFAEILGFCLMGNHFHLLVRMHPGSDYTDEEIKKRYKDFFKDEAENKDRELTDGQVNYYRSKWENLSEFIKYIKQGFSRFYNNRHHRRGFFWSERFKSVIVDNGQCFGDSIVISNSCQNIDEICTNNVCMCVYYWTIECKSTIHRMHLASVPINSLKTLPMGEYNLQLDIYH